MFTKKRCLIAGGILLFAILSGMALCGFLIVHRVEGNYFDSNGVRIHYTVEGQGEPLVLIHGVAANADLNWRYPGVIRTLSKRFRVIAFDLRGHGLSGKPHNIDQYGTQMVEDIARLMDHLQIRRAHMAGYSLGGFILLKFLATHPDRVASAAICAAGWKNPEDPSPIPNPYKPPVFEKSSPPAQADMSIAAAPKTLFHWVRSWVGDHIMDKSVKKALKEKYRDFAVPLSDLEKNHVPTLCIIGDRDGLLPLAYALRAHMSGLDFAEIPGAGHFTAPFRSQFKNNLQAFFLKHAGI